MGRRGGRRAGPEGGRERRSLCVGSGALGRSRPGPDAGTGELEGSGLPQLLCLSRGGGRARGTRSRDRVVGGGGGVRARLRLVARSRHYAGRHFLSDPGEERCGAGALASGAFSTPVAGPLPIPVSRALERERHVCARLATHVLSDFHGLRNGD